MANSQENRFVGPVIKNGEVGDAVLEAIHEDNKDRKIEIEEHASYFRIKVEKECVIRFATVSEMLGTYPIETRGHPRSHTSTYAASDSEYIGAWNPSPILLLKERRAISRDES